MSEPLSTRALLERLAARGVASRDLLDPTTPIARRAGEAIILEGDDPPPWFVRALIGAGTWVGAAIFSTFAGLFAAMIGLDGEVGRGLTGAGLVAGAALLSRAAPGGGLSVFAGQLTLIGAVAGSILLVSTVLGRALARGGDEAIALTTLAVAAVTTAAVADGVVRFLGAGCIVGAAVALTLIMDLRAGPLAVAALALAGAIACFVPDALLGRAGWRGLARPVGLGLAAAALCACGLGSHHPGARLLWTEVLAAHAALTLLLALVAALALGERGGALASGAGVVVLGSAALAGAVTVGSPGMPCALAVLALGQLRGEPLLRGLGVAGLAAHIGVLFWTEGRGSLLDVAGTLPGRAGALAGLGVTLLAARALLARFFAARAELDAVEGEPAGTARATGPGPGPGPDGAASGGAHPASGAAGPALRPARARLPRAAFAATAALLIGAVALTASRRERLLAGGATILLEASAHGIERAPVIGDGISVRFPLLDELDVGDADGRVVTVVVAPDAAGVSRLARRDAGGALAPGERRVRVRRRSLDGDRELRIGGNVLFASPGSAASPWQTRFAEVRVDEAGDAIITALFDESRVRIFER